MNKLNLSEFFFEILINKREEKYERIPTNQKWERSQYRYIFHQERVFTDHFTALVESF